MLLKINEISSEVLNEDGITSVRIPTENGSVQILNDHAPLYGVIKKGEIIYIKNKEEKKIEITKNGVFAVKDNIVTILLSL